MGRGREPPVTGGRVRAEAHPRNKIYWAREQPGARLLAGRLALLMS